MNTRFLGVLCMLGSVLYVLDALRMLVLDIPSFDTMNLVAGTLWAIGGICGLLGMIRQEAVGGNIVARVLACVPIVGFGLLIVGNALQLANLVTTETNTVAGFGWIFLLAGMVLVAILTIAARQWQGWQRFAPLLTVIAVPLGFGMGAALGNLTLGTALLFALWILLGYAVFTSERATELRPVQA